MNTRNASPQGGPYTMPESPGELYYTNKFTPPPEPNVKITFGNDTWTFLQYYCKAPPNRFQRWMMKKFLGINMELLK